MLPLGLESGFSCDFFVVGKLFICLFFFLSWVGTNGTINYLGSFISQSSHGYSRICSPSFLGNEFWCVSRLGCTAFVAQLWAAPVVGFISLLVRHVRLGVGHCRARSDSLV